MKCVALSFTHMSCREGCEREEINEISLGKSGYIARQIFPSCRIIKKIKNTSPDAALPRLQSLEARLVKIEKRTL